MMGSEVTFMPISLIWTFLNFVFLTLIIFLVIRCIKTIRKTFKQTQKNSEDIENIFKILKK